VTLLEQLFAQKSWEILEHRCRYYVFNAPTIDDVAYDALEQEYNALADRLGRARYASEMVGFDLQRPSCWSVYVKLKGET
jgi:NAD-dependent DNA ligase